MSNTGQSNGKKSSNSSVVNTPASTPVTNGNLPPSTHCSPPLLNNNAPNAPKYGTLVPNRIFVGGISANTTEGELMQLFSIYGTVKAAKIIQDRAGVSKGYGFITFENEDDARRPLRDSDNIVLRERKLNIAPAIKKQPFGIRAPPPSVFDGCPPGPGASPAPAPPPPIFFPPAAAAPYFQAYYVPPPPPQAQSHGGPGGQDQQHGQTQAQQVYQTPSVYPGQTGHPQAAYPSMMFPQPIYMPQQYPAMAMPFDYTVYPGNGGGPPGGHPNFGPGPCAPSGSSSPPRGPCYATAAYATGPPGPAETLFYNPTMQVFHTGGALDGAGPALYAATEAFDLGPHLAQYAEEVVAVEGASVETQPPPPPLPQPAAPQSPTSERNSATPVVSVLNLDKQQERDFASMQGGRRPRPSSPRKPPTAPIMNGYVPSMTYSSFNGGVPPRYVNNVPFNRMRYRKSYTSQHQQQFNDNSSTTSGNGEGENRTPPPRPPAPYSPLDRRIQHQRNMSYHHHHHHFAPPPSQVHPPQAVFSPPMRRPQRGKPTRRYQMPSEIGAGDAPLPSSTTNANDDVIAKVDALKI